MLATISSGYDSPACATVASAVGCDQAVTFVRGREDVPDDGLEVARRLKLRVISVERPISGVDLEAFVPEFFAVGMQGGGHHLRKIVGSRSRAPAHHGFSWR